MNGSVSGSIELEADCFARDRILKPSLFSLQNRMFSLPIRGSSPWRGTKQYKNLRERLALTGWPFSVWSLPSYTMIEARLS